MIKIELPEENANTVKEAFSACQTLIVKFVDSEPHSHREATIKQLAAVTHENEGKWLISKVNFIEDQVAA